MNLFKFFSKNYPENPDNKLKPKVPKFIAKEQSMAFVMKNEKLPGRMFISAGRRYNKYSLMDKIHILDYIKVKYLDMEIHAMVTMITVKGVGAQTDFGYKFIKWDKIISKRFKA